MVGLYLTLAAWLLYHHATLLNCIQLRDEVVSALEKQSTTKSLPELGSSISEKNLESKARDPSIAIRFPASLPLEDSPF